jgi:adenylate kinase
LVESKKIIIVGIPGVGKTTLIPKVVDIINQKNKSVSVHSFGTVMLEEGQKNGVKDRDDLRKLSVEKQKELQKIAAEKISSANEDYVIIDTHAFITTKAGFYPGLPEYVLQILKPDAFISVSARPEEIYNRRMKDSSRHRDIESIDEIKKEITVQEAILSACSVLCGAPLKPVLNTEGNVQEAAQIVIDSIGI